MTGLIFQQGPQLFEEVVDIVELAVDAGEADEGHLVEIAEIPHHQFSHLPALHFALVLLIDFVLDRRGGRLDLAAADGPLPAGSFEAAFDLFAVEGDAGAVFLDDFDRRFFGPLVGRETPTATGTLAPAADRQPVLARSGVDHAVVIGAAIGAFHIGFTIHRGLRGGRPLPPKFERRQNGSEMQPLSGILNIDKPPGITSRDAVNRIERLLGKAKCGHAGTLDPLATGVLVICVGQATRLIQYVQRMPKQYRAVFLLGRRSVTDDVEGELELIADAPEPTRPDIEAALPQFVGEIQQRPPAHSAIKIGGQRAYDLARRGEEFELAARTISIYRLEILRYEYPELEMSIECGSGTYVRSLGRDLAAALGTAGVMSSLVRTAIGSFRVEDAAQLDGLTAEGIQEQLQPPLEALRNLPQIVLTEKQLGEVRHGRPIEMRGVVRPPAEAGSPAAEWAAVDSEGRLAAILFEKLPNQLWPARNFEA